MSDVEHALAEMIRRVVREEIDRKLDDLAERLEQRPRARYLTVSEAAETTSISVRKIREAISAKELEVVRRGSRVCVHVDALDEWMERTA